MPQDSKKRRGRPVGTTKVSFEHQQHIWLRVELLREQLFVKTGMRPSASRACDLLARRGGLVWVAGGDIETIAKHMAQYKKSPVSKLRRANLVKVRFGFRLRNSRNGRVFVSHMLQHGRTIHARYKEANRIYRNDPQVREVWKNYLCDLLGHPRPSQPRIDMWRPSFVFTAPESN